MTEIPETIYSRARTALAYAQTAASSGEPEKAIEIIAREAMSEREQAALYVERISHKGLHNSMWRNKFKAVADGIRRGGP